MSTRANIEFVDEFGATLHLDRSHDGFPDQVLPDIKKTVETCTGRWSGSEMGQLMSHFLGSTFRRGERIQEYEPCHGLAGDESYLFFVKYNKESREYDYGVYGR